MIHFNLLQSYNELMICAPNPSHRKRRYFQTSRETMSSITTVTEPPKYWITVSVLRLLVFIPTFILFYSEIRINLHFVQNAMHHSQDAIAPYLSQQTHQILFNLS